MFSGDRFIDRNDRVSGPGLNRHDVSNLVSIKVNIYHNSAQKQ